MYVNLILELPVLKSSVVLLVFRIKFKILQAPE